MKTGRKIDETGRKNVESDLNKCVNRPKISGKGQEKQRKQT